MSFSWLIMGLHRFGLGRFTNRATRGRKFEMTMLSLLFFNSFEAKVLKLFETRPLEDT